MRHLETDSRPKSTAKMHKGEQMIEPANDTLPADLLFGADAIAAYLGISRRQAYRLVYDSIIPSFKAGATVVARKSSLNKWMAEAEQRGMAA
jgi:excisionase family DNA binding protein